jgi:ERCC4-type nuclease
MLLVDSREPRDIQLTVAHDVLVAHLEVGDFLDPSSGLLIERKTAPDLLSSLGDGSLMRQCYRMVQISRAPVLLIHGSLAPSRDGKVVADGYATGWNWWSHKMALVSITLGGVAVLHVGRRQLAQAVDKLRSWANKPVHRRVQRRREYDWWLPTKEQIVLSEAIGSISRASEIIARYGCLKAALSDIEGWTEIHGVGPATVRSAQEMFGRRK